MGEALREYRGDETAADTSVSLAKEEKTNKVSALDQGYLLYGSSSQEMFVCRREKLMLMTVLVIAAIGAYSLSARFENVSEECQDECTRQAVDCAKNRPVNSLNSMCAERHFVCDIECASR
jgi:hypothetical protein